MIVDVMRLMKLPEFQNTDEGVVKQRLEGLENLIRAYTNNNFQNRAIRFEASSLDDRLFGACPYIKVGDTVEITKSQVNDGLYVAKELDTNIVRLDRPMFQTTYNLVTKVQYPADIVQGIINLMKWEQTNRDKVGIKSETLSRYSVAYFDQDASNQVMGYPVSLMGFLKPYMKARF